jgi:hypothetical protein
VQLEGVACVLARAGAPGLTAHATLHDEICPSVLSRCLLQQAWSDCLKRDQLLHRSKHSTQAWKQKMQYEQLTTLKMVLLCTKASGKLLLAP